MTAKTQKRWIKSVLATARQDSSAMPWQRGTRRAAFVVKRQALPLKAKTA